MKMIEVTTLVPEDRVAEFYTFHGAFLSGDVMLRSEVEAQEAGAVPPRDLEGWHMPEGGVLSDQDNDVLRARDVMGKMTATARGIFQRLMWRPTERHTAEDLAAQVGLSSANAVAGALSWPGKYCYQMGKELPAKWARTQDGETTYWMDTETAQIFRWSQHPEKSLRELKETIEASLHGEPDETP